MKSNDMIQNRDEIRARMQQALKDNDTDGFYQAFDDMISYIGDDVRQRYEEQVGELKNEMDSRILSQRGVRQLTNKEHEYYQKLSNAMKAPNPKQALTDADLVMPKTIMNAVFDELQTSHPLLSRIEFISTTGLTEMIMNTNGYQEAAWGKLCDEIIKEISSGFKTVSMTFLKLSAFIPVCKAMLDLGPEWLDNYVRQVLYEALANGLEAGIVTGDGNDKPIGMVRQVGDGVTVKGGVYPEKAKIKVTDLSPDTVGNLLSLIAVDPNGKPRTVRDLLLLVNPQDYFQKVMPATTLMAPDGSYRNDVMPYPMTIIPTPSLERGNAVLGMGYKYFAGAGMAKEGRVEYSDEYHFLEDERVYLIKLYANGFPMDNNAFLYLDISGLLPADNGSILIDGHLPGLVSKSIVSYLPERTYLNDWMKVSEVLQFFSDFYADFDLERAQQMLADLHLSPNTRLKTMSKGTKEKVQLILVMSRRAQLYLLDEPIGGVDPAAREYILNTILKNFDESSSILITTHLIQDVEAIFDQVLFLNQGKIVIDGEVDEIRQQHGKSIDRLFREVFKC